MKSKKMKISGKGGKREGAGRKTVRPIGARPYLLFKDQGAPAPSAVRAALDCSIMLMEAYSQDLSGFQSRAKALAKNLLSQHGREFGFRLANTGAEKMEGNG